MLDANPQEEISRLLSAYWHSQAVYVAARLGLADLLAAGPRTADELAEVAGTNARALYRLLRALASLGIFAEQEDRRFVLTPLAECLRSDVPGSVRAMALMRGGWQYETWGRLLDSIRTGESAFEKIHGMPLFDYLGRHPDKGQLFDEAMTGVHGRETQAMLEVYDFSGITRLADIGGGSGGLLIAVLGAYPQLRGLLFDLPAVTERTRARPTSAGLEERCEAVSGSFFESVPAGADAYLMRHILHDWDDDRALQILRNCRHAIRERGLLLVVEGIVPPGNEPSLSKFFDLAMLVGPGGLERTEEEYRRLFEAAGFRLERIVPTRTWVSVIEGKPV